MLAPASIAICWQTPCNLTFGGCPCWCENGKELVAFYTASIHQSRVAFRSVYSNYWVCLWLWLLRCTSNKPVAVGANIKKYEVKRY